MARPATRCRPDVVAVRAAAPRIVVGARLGSPAIRLSGGQDGFGEQSSVVARALVPA